MRVRGLIVETPPLGGKTFSHKAQLFIIYMTMRRGKYWKGRVWRHARARSFRTRIRRSILGTCSLRVAKFPIMPISWRCRRIASSELCANVPDIEQQIRVLKERARACPHTLPFKYLPRLIVIEMMNNCALWLNVFPPRVSFQQSARAL